MGPPSPRFGGDYAVLELDDTREFEAPDMVGEAQAVPAKQGAESGFPQDEEDDWSNDGGLLSQVIDMQDRVEQRQQEDLLLQQQQQQQQQHKNKKRKQDSVSSSTSNSKRAKQKKQQQLQQEKVSRTVPEPSTPPTGGVV